jgi:hypothetical protein
MSSSEECQNVVMMSFAKSAMCQEVSDETLVTVMMPQEIPDDKNPIFSLFHLLLPIPLKREEERPLRW